MSSRSSYVIAQDECIPEYCDLCEGPIPEAGKPGVWLFKFTVTDAGRFRVSALCPECGMKHCAPLAATLAAAWREHHALYAGDAHAH